LMNSRQHGSEEALAELAANALGRPAASALVGGLGMGFTLRAALDRLPVGARVTVAELLPQVVEWNREHLAELAGRPLDDPRVRGLVGDVAGEIRRPLAADNGPRRTGRDGNGQVDPAAGLERGRAALTPGGVLAIWPASDSPPFANRLQRARVEVRHERGRAHGKRGARHTVWLARRP